MEIEIINTHHDGAYVTVTYKYWSKGQCACKGEKINRSFTLKPTKQDLINAI